MSRPVGRSEASSLVGRVAVVAALGAIALAAGLATAGAVGTANAASARDEPSCSSPPLTGPVIAQPSTQQLTLAPDRIWSATAGQGVSVAVLDTGVDTAHPQLREVVSPYGWDMVDDRPGGALDCAAHGSAVASVIAAHGVDGTRFVGLAPGVGITSIRVAEQASGPGRAPADPAALAAAIRWAVEAEADVINISVLSADAEELRSAVQFARERDVVVVASAGAGGNAPPRGAQVTAYPAAYPEVISVAGVDASGTRLADAPPAEHVDLAAPGTDVLAALPGSGHAVFAGSDMATPMVSAAAALVRAAYPAMSAQEVQDRLVATADVVPDAVGSGYVRGMVDPYRAVAEVLPGQHAPRELPTMPSPTFDAAAEQRAAHWRTLTRRALLAALAVVAAAVVAGVVLLILRRRASLAAQGASPPPPVDDPASSGAGEPRGVLLDDDPLERYFTVPSARPPG